MSRSTIESVPGDLANKDIDKVAEVRVTEVGFRGGRGALPKVNFYMNARVRLLEKDTYSVIYTRDFQYLSRELPFVDWFNDRSQELLSAYGFALDTLAERILDELFIVTNFPFDSGLWALPGQPEFGSCWFRPLYPELKYTSLWHSIRHNSPGIHVQYTEVDSLQPLFQW